MFHVKQCPGMVLPPLPGGRGGSGGQGAVVSVWITAYDPATVDQATNPVSTAMARI
jgi:hypothetical protein